MAAHDNPVCASKPLLRLLLHLGHAWFFSLHCNVEVVIGFYGRTATFPACGMGNTVKRRRVREGVFRPGPQQRQREMEELEAERERQRQLIAAGARERKR